MLHSNPGDYAWGQSGLDAIVTQVSAAPRTALQHSHHLQGCLTPPRSCGTGRDREGMGGEGGEEREKGEMGP